MEENILDYLALQLVDYFINYENYQPFNIPEKFRERTKGKVYLISKENRKYQIIRLIKQTEANATEIKASSDAVIEEIKKEVLKTEVKVLNLVLNSNNHNEIQQSPTIDTIIASPGHVTSELSKFFSNIGRIVKDEPVSENEDTTKNLDDEEGEEISSRERKWKKVNFENRRFLKDALTKSTNQHLVVTWLFIAVPIVTYFIFLFICNNNSSLSSLIGANNSFVVRLFFGSSYHNLIFGANQYWRWLTYPFVQLDSLTLIISLWLFSRVGRYIEGFYGIWKTLVIWIAAVFLVGIIQSTVDYYSEMSGFMILVLISLGAMIPIIWNYKLFKSQIMGKITFTVVILALYWMLLDARVITLLYWMIALAAGWIMGAVVSYHNRKLTLFYAFSPVAIGLLLLFALLMFFLTPYYNLDENNNTISTLILYKQFNLVSQSFIDWVNSHYFYR